MEENNEKRTVTPMDVAKFVGAEKEYRETLNEQELKKNYDIIMGDNIEKNNIILNDMET